MDKDRLPSRLISIGTLNLLGQTGSISFSFACLFLLTFCLFHKCFPSLISSFLQILSLAATSLYLLILLGYVPVTVVTPAMATLRGLRRFSKQSKDRRSLVLLISFAAPEKTQRKRWHGWMNDIMLASCDQF